MPDIITFGEAMIRLSPPNFRRLEQAPRPLNQRVGALVGSPVKVTVGEQHRQHHVAAALPQREDQAAGVGLGAKRTVLPQRRTGRSAATALRVVAVADLTMLRQAIRRRTFSSRSSSRLSSSASA